MWAAGEAHRVPIAVSNVLRTHAETVCLLALAAASTRFRSSGLTLTGIWYRDMFEDELMIEIDRCWNPGSDIRAPFGSGRYGTTERWIQATAISRLSQIRTLPPSRLP